MEGTRKKKILVVDDQTAVQRYITGVLEQNDYAFETADNGAIGIEKARTFSPDLIYMDQMMPVMDGFDACRKLKNDPATWHIPIIMITAATERDSMILALECGANDFLTKPVDAVEMMLRTKNLIKLKESEEFIREYSVRLDAEVRRRTTDLHTTNTQLEESRKMLKEGYIDTVHKLTMIAEHKDSDTAVHIKRVGYLCAFLTKAIGWHEDDAELIFYASPMHDIGKCAIPSEILLKSGKLNAEEFALMKTHTTAGAKVLSGSQSVILQMAERIALTHHERWDGKGYPAGLKGAEIPVEGAVMNIVDQYDALRSPRPYKTQFGHEKVFTIITSGDGRTGPSHFNPLLLEVFTNNHKEFERIYEEHSKEENGGN